MTAQKLLTTEDLVEETGIPKRTFDSYAYTGAGPAFIKLGRHRRYAREDVDAWIAANRHGGPNAA